MKSTYGMPDNPIRVARLRHGGAKPIGNTRRVKRVLRLIKYLNEFRSIRQIASHLELHEKSVNRYLILLVQLGFKVEVGYKKYTYFRIVNTKEFFNLE